MSNFISLKELVERDVNFKNLESKYQVQSQKNTNHIRVIKLNKCVPDVCIYSYELGDFNCSLLQLTITEKDIDNLYFPLLCYLIKTKENKIIGTLILSFEPKYVVNINENIDGIFKITLSNENRENKIIKTFDNYCGNEEAVYLMTEVLGDILEEIIKEN